MSQQPILDHIAIYITNLKKGSGLFTVMCWALISCQSLFAMAKHAWFATGQGKQLHIIEGANQPDGPTEKKITPASALLLCRISLPG